MAILSLATVRWCGSRAQGSSIAHFFLSALVAYLLHLCSTSLFAPMSKGSGRHDNMVLLEHESLSGGPWNRLAVPFGS